VDVNFIHYSVQIYGAGVKNDDGSAHGPFPLRTFRHQGKTLIIGEKGQEYHIVIRNHGFERIEAVVSVDGIDVLKGKEASVSSMGYVINGYQELWLSGFRLTDEKVAQFKFGDTASSYAASKGKPRSIGVIGVAIFKEKQVPVTITLPRIDTPWCPNRPWPFRDIPLYYGPIPVNNEYTITGPWYYFNTTKGTSTTTNSDGEYVLSCRTSGTTSNATVNMVSAAPASLGTEFGRPVESRVTEVEFTRDSRKPVEVFRFYYDTKEAFVAMGIPMPELTEAETKDRLNVDPFPASPKEYCEPPKGWEGNK
jgi:hypothetical protein